MRNASVLISGLGIAGPTLAFWLLEHGCTPIVLECAPHPRRGGYVIDFWGTGYNVAERMGLEPDLRRVGYNVQALRFVDGHGRRVGGFDADVFRRMTNGRYVSLQRGDLADLLYRRIEERCEIKFDTSIAYAELRADGVRVKLGDAPPRLFDAVIGADGLHSNVRSLMFGPEKEFESYLGYAVAAFEVQGYRPRDEDIYVSYAVPGKQVARFSLRDDRTLFLLVFQAPKAPPYDPSSQRALLHREFEHVGWECPDILTAMDQTDDVYFDSASQIQMSDWSRDCVTLVGDAAFCPSLLAGEGAALAMTAAYVLAGEIAAADGEMAQAFRNYEHLLHPFIAGKQRSARQFASSFVPGTEAGIVLRNALTRLFSIPFVR